MSCFRLAPSRLLIAVDATPVVSVAFKNTPLDSGVYAIRCRYNGRTYVGSSKNIKRRWLRHRGDLRGGIHHSPHLQRAWDKYGEQGFEFFVLSYCAVDELLEHEQFWLDSSTCFYNGSRTVGRVDHTPETRARIGEKVRAAHQRPEVKAKMRLRRKAAPRTGPMSPEQKETLKRIHRDKNRRVPAFGRLWSIKDLAEEYGVKYTMLKDRLRAGWDAERAVLTPKRGAWT